MQSDRLYTMYFAINREMLPKLSIPTRDPGPHLTNGSFDPPRLNITNSISIGSAVLAHSSRSCPPDRQTGRPADQGPLVTAGRMFALCARDTVEQQQCSRCEQNVRRSRLASACVPFP